MEIPPPQYPSFHFIPLIPKQALEKGKIPPRPRVACPYPLGLLPLPLGLHTLECAPPPTPPPVAGIHPSRCPANARCRSRRRQGLDLGLHHPGEARKGPRWPDLAPASSPTPAHVDEAEVPWGCG
jgi:hypothetical protein